MHHSEDTAHTKIQLYLILPIKVIQGQSNEVDWNTIYDLLYVFHINFCHKMHHSEDTAH